MPTRTANGGRSPTRSSLDVPDDAGCSGSSDDTSQPCRRSDPCASTPRWWLYHTAAATLAPIAVFLLLRPESYGLTPNALDPIFYTGYAINFDDIMREIGTGRYFVSRWSAYYPNFIATRLFGAELGRLVVRLVLASAMLMSIWHLGRRWKWSIRTEFVVGLVVLTLPMFARAFLTDYVEYTIVSIGFILVCQCLEVRASIARSVAIGVLASVLLVANPLAATMLGAPLLGYVLLDRSARPRRALSVGAIAVGAGLTLVFGYFLFHRYGVHNVYQPSIDFVRNQPTYRDPLKSPRLTWLLHYTWIYGPPLLLASFAVIPDMRSRLVRDRTALACAALLLVQYLWQWFDQFVRDGDGLEITYYWSYLCPIFTVNICMFIGMYPIRRWATPIAFAALWVAMLDWRSWAPFRLPAGAGFAVVALVVLGVTAWIAAKKPAGAWAPVVVLIALTQVAAPRWHPLAFHPYDTSARYDEIFFNAGSLSDLTFDEARWFEDRLDSIPDDDDLSFVTTLPNQAAPSATDQAYYITALYGAHLTGSLIRPDPTTGTLTDATIQELRAAGRPQVAIYGPPEFVRGILVTLDDVPATKVLDEEHQGGLGYRLVVLDPLGDDAD